MKEPQVLKLIRDLNSDNYRIVLQYVDIKTNTPVSPTFANQVLASEWYIDWLYSQYSGTERRQSIVDRRRAQKRSQFDLRSEGRRRADQPVDFEDRVGWMLSDLAKLRRG